MASSSPVDFQELSQRLDALTARVAQLEETLAEKPTKRAAAKTGSKKSKAAKSMSPGELIQTFDASSEEAPSRATSAAVAKSKPRFNVVDYFAQNFVEKYQKSLPDYVLEHLTEFEQKESFKSKKTDADRVKARANCVYRFMSELAKSDDESKRTWAADLKALVRSNYESGEESSQQESDEATVLQ